ncbi:hypothetical protein BC832DRAFT_566875 [Gaertneriomyces semiglobifer]|nr:hypothetical protein BC832DRAFT_566875 [Gaertneriomyces semiglobifer]
MANTKAPFARRQRRGVFFLSLIVVLGLFCMLTVPVPVHAHARSHTPTRPSTNNHHVKREVKDAPVMAEQRHLPIGSEVVIPDTAEFDEFDNVGVHEGSVMGGEGSELIQGQEQGQQGQQGQGQEQSQGQNQDARLVARQRHRLLDNGVVIPHVMDVEDELMASFKAAGGSGSGSGSGVDKGEKLEAPVMAEQRHRPNDVEGGDVLDDGMDGNPGGNGLPDASVGGNVDVNLGVGNVTDGSAVSVTSAGESFSSEEYGSTTTATMDGMTSTADDGATATPAATEGPATIDIDVDIPNLSNTTHVTKRSIKPKEFTFADLPPLAPLSLPAPKVWLSTTTSSKWDQTWNITHWSYGTSNIAVARDPSLQSPSTVLQITYPAKSRNPTGPIIGGVGFYLSPLPNLAQHTHLTLSYAIYFPPNFNFVKGGKLPGLYGGSRSCTGGDAATDCFSSRFMFRRNGDGEIYIYAPDKPQHKDWCHVPPRTLCNEDGYGTSMGRGAFRFLPGRWTHISQTLILNTFDSKGNPNQDGVILVYEGGRKVIEYRKAVLAASPKVRFEGIDFETFFGGSDDSWATPKLQRVFFKDFFLLAN